MGEYPQFFPARAGKIPRGKLRGLSRVRFKPWSVMKNETTVTELLSATSMNS